MLHGPNVGKPVINIKCSFMPFVSCCPSLPVESTKASWNEGSCLRKQCIIPSPRIETGILQSWVQHPNHWSHRYRKWNLKRGIYNELFKAWTNWSAVKSFLTMTILFRCRHLSTFFKRRRVGLKGDLAVGSFCFFSQIKYPYRPSVGNLKMSPLTRSLRVHKKGQNRKFIINYSVMNLKN